MTASSSQPDENQKPIKPEMALLAGGASVETVLILILIKMFAWQYSGSAAVMASLTDSIIDGAVSVMSFFAIRYSLEPPDAEHRYGHGKIEGLAALGQGVLIALGGILLIVESLSRFTSGAPVEHHMIAVIVMGISTVLSIILVGIQRYTLRYAKSLAVEADKAHYDTDIAINVGVAVVILLLYYGAPLWIDPLFAIAVAVYLGLTVKHVVGEGLNMLLDRELPDEERDRIQAIVTRHPQVLDFHDLRTHRSGMRVFMSFDIEADPHLSLLHAHEIALDVEKALLKEFPEAEIMIHIDPQGAPVDQRHRVEGVHI